MPVCAVWLVALLMPWPHSFCHFSPTLFFLCTLLRERNERGHIRTSPLPSTIPILNFCSHAIYPLYNSILTSLNWGFIFYHELFRKSIKYRWPPSTAYHSSPPATLFEPISCIVLSLIDFIIDDYKTFSSIFSESFPYFFWFGVVSQQTFNTVSVCW